ncbi:MAG TPA: disulfide bond formation protein B [Spongiibacteraceae bacterium]|nr:disulfide bond formation protein B [Spongiibacteraceae bacterium]
MPSSVSPRAVFFAMAVVIAVCFSVALYTQYVDGLSPCPLCMTQRVFYVLTAFVALIAVLHNRGTRVYGALCALSSVAGAAVAARQVWLQHLPPDQVPACGPSLEYMLQTLPFGTVILHMLKGDGNCAIVDWRLWGLSMAEWSLLCFIALMIVSAILAIRPALFGGAAKVSA